MVFYMVMNKMGILLSNNKYSGVTMSGYNVGKVVSPRNQWLQTLATERNRL